MAEQPNLIKPIERFIRLVLVDIDIVYKLYTYAIFLGGLNLTLPLGVQAIIGLISSGRINTTWVALILFTVLGITLYGITNYFQMQLLEKMQQRIFTRAALEFAYRIPRMRLDNLYQYYPPELVNRFFDILTVQKGLSKILMDFSTSVLQILFGLVLLGFYHSLFVFFGFFLLLILVSIIYFSGPLGLASSIKESKYKYEIVYWLEELARALETFKLAGEPLFAMDKTDRLTQKYLEYRTKHFKILAFQYSTIVVFKVIVTVGLLVLGSFLVISKEINVAQFVASEIVIILVMSSTEKLITSLEVIYDVLTALDKIGYLTDIPMEPIGGVKFQDIDTGKGMKLTIRNLHYKHPFADFEAIKGINLDIQPNEKVCIAGFSGSGKTTLITLIAGIVDDYQGVISYNDNPFHVLDRTSLREHIGDTLSQEIIFHGTIEENIWLSKDEVSRDLMLWAADAVGLTESVSKLPLGFDTELQANDKRFPSSFLRKIILARSFAEKPRLLVMDDIIYGFDYHDTQKIINTLVNPAHNWTLIIVTRNPEIAKACDRIIVMKDGQILEEGTYHDIQQKPYYNEIFYY